MAPSSPKLELRGREHSNCTSWAQRTVAPKLRPPKIKLLDFLYGEWGDIVYSYGVIHHTPNIEAAAREIYRVLKPGGETRIMVYAKYSEFNLYVLLKGLIRLDFLRYGYAATISHWCEGTAWDNPVPVGRFSKREVQRMFSQAGFKCIQISKYLLTQGNIPIVGRFLSNHALERLAHCIGWNLIIKAEK
jgi:SAM-dependent methyltransferase